MATLKYWDVASGTYKYISTVGLTGPQGPTGPTGATGPGVATGGTAGQLLSKVDATNYNTQWSDPAYDYLNSNQMITGEEVFPRILVRDNSLAAVSGQIRLSHFTARKTESITQLSVATGSTAAGATPTLIRMGVYSVAGTDGQGDLTLVASTPNDTTLLAAQNTLYTKGLSASWSKVAGQRYAIGIIVVTAATAPTFVTMQQQAQADCFTSAPRLNSARNSQADLVTPIVAANLVQVNGMIYFSMKP